MTHPFPRDRTGKRPLTELWTAVAYRGAVGSVEQPSAVVAHSLRHAAVVASVLAAGAAFAVMARTGAIGGPVAAIVVTDMALGLALYAGRGALDVRLFGTRMTAVVKPALLAIAGQTAVGFALFPFSHPDDEPDYSWFGVVPVLTVLLGLGAGLLALLAVAMVVAPLCTVVIATPAALRGDLAAAQRLLLAIAVLDVTALATSLAVIDPSDGRANLVRMVALLVGALDPADGHTGLAWLARGTVALLAAVVGLLVLVRRAIKRGGGDPDEGYPDGS